MPSKPHSDQRQRVCFVGLRLLPAERAALEAAARDQSVSLSEFIRASALQAAGAVKEES